MADHDTQSPAPGPRDPRAALDESNPLSVIFHMAGQNGLDRFLTACGGRDYYFPRRILKADILVTLFGADMALDLASRFGGGSVYIPTTVLTPRVRQLAARLRAIRDANPGITVAMIAERAGCSERQVYRYLGRIRTAQGVVSRPLA